MEVDFVIKKNNKLTGINVSYGKELDDREIISLLQFKETFSKNVKELIVITKDLEKVSQEIKFIPLWKWLLKEA
jgi:predicted AAA+ superfamily ATPase